MNKSQMVIQIEMDEAGGVRFGVQGGNMALAVFALESAKNALFKQASGEKPAEPGGSPILLAQAEPDWSKLRNGGVP